MVYSIRRSCSNSWWGVSNKVLLYTQKKIGGRSNEEIGGSSEEKIGGRSIERDRGRIEEIEVYSKWMI